MILTGTAEQLASLGIAPAPALEREIAAMVRAEFSLEARIDRARKAHRARRYLLRAFQLAKAREIAA